MEDFQTYLTLYGDYLDDLRKRLYRTVILFIAVFATGFLCTGTILKFLIRVLKIRDATIVATSPFQLIDLAMNVGLFCAIVIILPYIVHQIYGFLRAGLHAPERALFIRLIPVGLFLFLLGFAYGFGVMYYALAVIASVNVGLGIVNLWDISQFFSQIMITSALLGVLFEIPLILSFLVRLNILSVQFLRDKRPYATVFILVLVALLPPTDGLSFVVMSVPLLLIYELVIVLNMFHRPKPIRALERA